MPSYAKTITGSRPGFSCSMICLGTVMAVTSILLSGCNATMPVSDDRSITPQQVVAGEDHHISSAIQWGGVIVSNQNLKYSTELEIIAYPLNSNGKPDTSASPQGRFIAINRGYLETVDYAIGRLTTLNGSIKEIRNGKVGNAHYRYPMVRVDRITLWPKDSGIERKPRIYFGIGVGSGGYSGGDIGIGF